MAEIGVGVGARVTRAQQAVLDLTGNQVRDTEIIQAAIDAAVAEATAVPPPAPPVEEIEVETASIEDKPKLRKR